MRIARTARFESVDEDSLRSLIEEAAATPDT